MSSIRAVLRDVVLRFVIALIITSLAAAAAMIFGSRWVDDFIKDLPRIDKEETKGLENIDPGDPQTYLVIGSDTRAFVGDFNSEAGQAFCKEEGRCDTTQRSDSIMMVHIDPSNNSVFVVSISRDVVVDINGRRSKINAAFLDGPGGLIKALDENFHIKINHVAIVDFEQFQEINRVVGGVHVSFPYPARDKKLKVEFNQTGCINLDPGQALSYVRSRSMEEKRNGKWVYTHGIPDIGRIQRQQDYFRRLAQKAAGQAGNPNDFLDLANKVKKFVAVDSFFGRDDFLRLVAAISKIDFGSDGGVEMVTFPWVNAGNNSDLLPDNDYWPAIADRLNGGEAPETKAVDIKLRVLNASGVDGAAKTVSDFYTNNFNVGKADPATGNADQLADTTIVKYATGAFEKAKPLLAFLGAPPVEQDASLTDADVLIILGKDFKGLVDYENALKEQASATSTTTTTSAGTAKSTSTTTTTSLAPGFDPTAVECDP